MNPSKRSPSALLLGLLLLLPGCLMSRETSNTPLEPEVLTALEPGVSTGEDVARILGAPNEVVQLGRRSAWRYEFIQAKRSGLWLLVVAFQNLDARQDRVWVFFDEEDVLTHYGSTYEAEDADWGMPWQDLGADGEDGDGEDGDGEQDDAGEAEGE